MRLPEPLTALLPARRHAVPRSPWSRRLVTLVAAMAVLLVSVAPVVADNGLTMEAHVLLDGHARAGQWMAIDVHLTNSGPAVTGELRLAGGAQGRTRFSTPVDLPTQSDKVYRMYVQPPAFGRDVAISLVDGDSTVATTKAAFTLHDATQLVVGIVAERPGDIIGGLDLLPNQSRGVMLARLCERTLHGRGICLRAVAGPRHVVDRGRRIFTTSSINGFTS